MEHQYHFGRKFYLDKDTGYWISTDRPRVRAHTWVYSYHHEIVDCKIPEGLHIHHKDGDKSNNDISNLDVLSAKEHIKIHMTDERRQFHREWIDKIRPLTKAWHASEAGREWHKAHAAKCNFGNGPSLDYHCQMCGKDYKSKLKAEERTRFCSNACKSKWRRDSGLDDIECICQKCGTTFKSNKYEKRKFCSRKCSPGRPKNQIDTKAE